MKFIILLQFIFSFKCYLAIDTNKSIIVDFNETLVEIDVEKHISHLQFMCIDTCTWIIPQRMKSETQISIIGNYLTWKLNENIDKNINITICKSSLNGNSSVEYYDIPSCCPCCPWYNQSLCDRFSHKYINCSTFILYSFNEISNTAHNPTIYENTMFVLPCKMRLSHLKDNLEIINVAKNQAYLKYSDGKLQSIFENMSYNPTSGLCFNTSIIIKSLTIRCQYEEDNKMITYRVETIDFHSIKFRSKIEFFNLKKSTNSIIKIPTNSVIKLLKNQTVNFKCMVNTPLETKKFVTCMKFDLLDRIELNEFFCSEIQGYVEKLLTINTSNLKNQSTIKCYLRCPTGTAQAISNATILLFDKESLEIQNLHQWNNVTRKVYQTQKPIELLILFNSIPTNSRVNCSLVKNETIEFQSSCKIIIPGKCDCKIKINPLFINKIPSSISISLSSARITKSVSLWLQPIYLQIPKLTGLDSLFKKRKEIQCQSKSSQPYNITWKIVFNDEQNYTYYSENNVLIISMNDSVRSICCQCIIANELGSNNSENICHNVTGANIRLQGGLLNFSTWNSKIPAAEDERKNHRNIYYILTGSFVIILVIICILIRFIHKSRYAVPIIQIQNNIYKSLDTDSAQLLCHIWPDPLERRKWTIKPSCRIQILKEIGEGNYGKIYKGILANHDGTLEQLVALKQPILTNQLTKAKNIGELQFCQISLECFMNEIKVLSKLTNCSNIIKMHGCTIFQNGMEEEDSNREPTTLLVLEFCANRSLTEFLTKNSVMFSPYTKFRKLTELNGYTGMKMDEGITLLDLKKISLGIAIGLDYLSGLSIIHRDLATRNILIDDQKNPKICDFGLAIELETDIAVSNTYQILTHNKALPFKILAPEVLESRSFCLESDVWSFGLLLWQMFNLEQETLFPHLDNPISLLKYIRSQLIDDELKELLPIPKYADEWIWKLIKSCWTYEPINRPSGNLLRIELIEIIRSSPVEVIRVSSGYQTDPHSRESITSSKFPSTRTSLITLNYPILPISNTSNENFYFFEELPSETLIDESPL